MISHLFIISALFLSFWNPLFAVDETNLKAKIDQKNKEIERLEEEIKEYQDNLGKINTKSQTLKSEIFRIENEIKNLNSKISLTQKKIQKKELEIKDLSGKIGNTEVSLVGLKNALGKNLRQLYEAEAFNAIEILFSFKNISDFFGVLEEGQKLSSSIENTVIELQDTKTFLNERKEEAESAKKDLSGLKNELFDQKSIQNIQKNEKSTLLKLTKNEEEKFQQLLSDKEREREEILDEIQKIEDELRGSINLNNLPGAGSGVLAWPIKGAAVLTQDFGNTPYSKILYNGKPHNGIDIKAPLGTQVFSSERGVVKEVGDTDQFGKGTRKPCLSYGKWVLIEHGNGLSTLYAHLSLIRVKKGDTIEREGFLGYSGSTGYATGPHLHFTVYDSSTVQFGPSKLPKSTCQFLPFGGYLNPLAYL